MSVPGLAGDLGLPPHLCGFFTPPAVGADFRAALVASCLRGALPPVDLRAVCHHRQRQAKQGEHEKEALARDYDENRSVVSAPANLNRLGAGSQTFDVNLGRSRESQPIEGSLIMRTNPGARTDLTDKKLGT